MHLLFTLLVLALLSGQASPVSADIAEPRPRQRLGVVPDVIWTKPYARVKTIRVTRGHYFESARGSVTLAIDLPGPCVWELRLCAPDGAPDVWCTGEITEFGPETIRITLPIPSKLVDGDEAVYKLTAEARLYRYDRVERQKQDFDTPTSVSREPRRHAELSLDNIPAGEKIRVKPLRVGRLGTGEEMVPKTIGDGHVYTLRDTDGEVLHCEHTLTFVKREGNVRILFDGEDSSS